MVAKAMLHYGEEPCLTSHTSPASGAIFFSGCNLRCVYCQNYSVSHKEICGKKLSPKQLAELFKKLESAGAANIDLVTPTHYASQIVKALKIYKPKIPVIYNCGGYESEQTIAIVAPLVDIFLFDLKYYDNNLATKYSKAPNYFNYATKAIILASKLKPNIYDGEKLLQGVIIRHLCLPNCTRDSLSVLDWIANNVGKNTIVSLMSQYTPYGEAKNYPEINRPLKKLEYKAVVSHAKTLGLTNTFVQDITSATTEQIPNFKDLGEFLS